MELVSLETAEESQSLAEYIRQGTFKSPQQIYFLPPAAPQPKVFQALPPDLKLASTLRPAHTIMAKS